MAGRPPKKENVENVKITAEPQENKIAKKLSEVEKAIRNLLWNAENRFYDRPTIVKELKEIVEKYFGK